MSTLPTQILAPTDSGQALSTLITATSLSTSTTSSSTPTTTTTTAESLTATPSKHVTSSSSLIDPPTIAGITVGALFAGVLAFCLVGGLVHWLSERKRAQYRKAYAQAHAHAHRPGRWGPDNDQNPPRETSNTLAPPAALGSYPKMIESPTAGHRVNPDKIGMAISEDPADGAPAASMHQSIQPFGNVGMSRDHQNQADFDYPPRQKTYSDARVPVFPEDDTPLRQLSQEQPLSPRDPSTASALRPRAAPRTNPFQKRSPPPLEIPLNNSGAPPTRICPPPRREPRIQVEAASNAHARIYDIMTPQHRRKITPEDIMKPLPKPASPDLFAPELRPPLASYLLACKDRRAMTKMTLHPPSPTISAVPSSNLEGNTNQVEKHADLIVPSNSLRQPSTSTATSFSMTNSVASHSTAFESLHSDDVNLEEVTSCTTPRAPTFHRATTPVIPNSHHSIHYPRVPRSANEHVPRAITIDNDPSSLLSTRTAPLPSTPTQIMPRTPLSASSAVFTPARTPRQRIQPKRINTSPANSGLTLVSVTPVPPFRNQQTIPHGRNLSSTTIVPQTHQRGKSSSGTTATESVEGTEMRSTLSTPWSAGCGAIEVALRSPTWAFGLGSPILDVY